MRVKKFKSIMFFIVGVGIVFALIATRQYFKTLPAHGSTTGNLVVYDDQLQNGFANWSWNSSVDVNNSSSVFSGSKAIAFTPNAWGGLYFHNDSTIDSSQYSSLQFSLQTSDAEKNFNVIFYDSNNNQIQPAVSLSQYSGTLQNGWKVYTIPLNQAIKGFALQEISGNSGPTSYIDSVQFIAKQQATTASSSIYAIYTDSLVSGWMNWSWNSTVNLGNTISFTPGAYGGLYLHTESGVDTSPYSFLTFTAKASTDGESFGIGVFDANNQLLHSAVSLDQYGGQPTSGSWKTYTIPLSDLNANNKIIKGVMIQDISGHSEQALFIDNISLTSNTSPQPTTAPIPTNGPTIPQAINNTINSTPVVGNPLSGTKFFNDSDSDPALQQEKQWQSSRPTDAAMIAKIADQPKAVWMGSWNNNIQSDVQNEMSKAESTNSLPVFVSYNIPNRDCGSYSAGGSSSGSSYQTWIDSFASGIGNRRAAIILEPDALAQITCLSQSDQQQRLNLLSYAIQKFKSLGQTAVYVDAGNANWIDANTMAARLKSAGVASADGFAINVSNFDGDQGSISYAQQVSSLLQGKHFVIDTSRNGNGPTTDGTWCNPSGRALGDKPTTQTGNPLVDAYLWIKYPGESDGSCNGAPAAGVWYPDYALGLAQQAKW